MCLGYLTIKRIELDYFTCLYMFLKAASSMTALWPRRVSQNTSQSTIDGLISQRVRSSSTQGLVVLGKHIKRAQIQPNVLQSHPQLTTHSQMDSFSTIIVPTSIPTSEETPGGSGGQAYCVVSHAPLSIPTDQETPGGSGGQAYCVIAWAHFARDWRGQYPSSFFRVCMTSFNLRFCNCLWWYLRTSIYSHPIRPHCIAIFLKPR